jgi:hypothetical protein
MRQKVNCMRHEDTVEPLRSQGWITSVTGVHKAFYSCFLFLIHSILSVNVSVMGDRSGGMTMLAINTEGV